MCVVSVYYIITLGLVLAPSVLKVERVTELNLYLAASFSGVCKMDGGDQGSETS